MLQAKETCAIGTYERAAAPPPPRERTSHKRTKQQEGMVGEGFGACTTAESPPLEQTVIHGLFTGWTCTADALQKS